MVEHSASQPFYRHEKYRIMEKKVDSATSELSSIRELINSSVDTIESKIVWLVEMILERDERISELEASNKDLITFVNKSLSDFKVRIDAKEEKKIATVVKKPNLRKTKK